MFTGIFGSCVSEKLVSTQTLHITEPKPMHKQMTYFLWLLTALVLQDMDMHVVKCCHVLIDVTPKLNRVSFSYL